MVKCSLRWQAHCQASLSERGQSRRFGQAHDCTEVINSFECNWLRVSRTALASSWVQRLTAPPDGGAVKLIMADP